MIDLTVPGWIALVVAQAALVAAACAATTPGPLRFLALPACLVLLEAVRSRWPLGGFPLASPSLGQVDGPLLDLARIGGSLTLVAATAALGCAAVAVVQRGPRASRALGVAGLVTIGLVTTAAGLLTSPPPPTGTLRVAAVQGGGPLGTHAVDTDEREVFERHLDASDQIPVGTELAVWPEDAIDVAKFDGTATAREASSLARRLDAWLLVGVVEDAGEHHFRNTAVMIDPDGRLRDRYDKVHRVPFGEYVPARSFVERLADLSRVPRDAIPGTGPGVVVADETPIGVAISFEVFYPQRTRDAVRAGGELLAIPTNASSYRRPVPAHETLAASRLRAVETGRDLVQAAPTGFSGLVDADGVVLDRSELSEQTVVSGTLVRRRGTTLYVAAGDFPIVAVAAAALIAAWVALARSPKRI